MLKILLDAKPLKKAQFFDYRGETVPW